MRRYVGSGHLAAWVAVVSGHQVPPPKAGEPSWVRHGERTFLFYNGNGCGRTGFGYAELEQSSA
jgi:hypothetical protein